MKKQKLKKCILDGRKPCKLAGGNFCKELCLPLRIKEKSLNK